MPIEVPPLRDVSDNPINSLLIEGMTVFMKHGIYIGEKIVLIDVRRP